MDFIADLPEAFDRGDFQKGDVRDNARPFAGQEFCHDLASATTSPGHDRNCSLKECAHEAEP